MLISAPSKRVAREKFAVSAPRSEPARSINVRRPFQSEGKNCVSDHREQDVVEDGRPLLTMLNVAFAPDILS